MIDVARMRQICEEERVPFPRYPDFGVVKEVDEDTFRWFCAIARDSNNVFTKDASKWL